MTGGKTTIEFQIEEISVLENSGRFPISLVRTGDSSEEVEVSAGLSFVESHYVYPDPHLWLAPGNGGHRGRVRGSRGGLHRGAWDRQVGKYKNVELKFFELKKW